MGAKIRERIQQQQDETERFLLETIETIGQLPPGHPGKAILQLRHIACCSWEAIQMEIHLTRSSCYRYYGRALDDLRRAPDIRARLGMDN